MMQTEIQARRTWYGGTALFLALSIGMTAYAIAGPPKTKSAGKKATSARPAGSVSPVAGDNTPLTEEQKIVHVLNRLGFGPRPGDIARVRQMGLTRYIEAQLNPETIDDSAIDAKLANLGLLKQTNEELASAFYSRLKGAVKLAKARETMEKAGATPEMMQDPNVPAGEKATRMRQAMDGMTPEEREQVREYRTIQQKIRQGGIELAVDKSVRAAESERQLQEVLVDFWSNHFNIDISKGACQVYKIADERDVVRKNLFGKFRDLLGASAKSPAMLFYLDNVQSVATPTMTPAQQRRQDAFLSRMERSDDPRAQQLSQQVKNRRRGGLNENYAREIMELHTLGVDGGYTQKDVQEVARCLTGWTISRLTGGFDFVAGRHDNGEKIVLGKTIPAGGGIRDGETVLDMLASHPSTMRYVSTKLCRRFVADEPPKSLVDKCVTTWKRTDGDLRAIYRTIFTSPEFFSRAAYRQKIKSPFEYAVSSVRALGATFEVADSEDNFGRNARLNPVRGGGMTRTVQGQVATMGQPLYRCQPPTGWTEDSRKWVSSGALIARLNYSLALVSGKLSDLKLDPTALPSGTTPAETVQRLAASLLQGEMTPSTRATLLKQATATPQDANLAETDTTVRLTALILGSPEFQRR
ncbi:MAG: DUF1800 domain-containing protein [Capsulimonadales bacterium]|nr:DUF1800 domain-containing protein [Capsulimonadales bacterium]